MTPAPTPRPRVDYGAIIRFVLIFVVCLLIWMGVAAWLAGRAGPLSIDCSGAVHGAVDVLFRIGCSTQYLAKGPPGIIFFLYFWGGLLLFILYFERFARRHRRRWRGRR